MCNSISPCSVPTCKIALPIRGSIGPKTLYTLTFCSREGLPSSAELSHSLKVSDRSLQSWLNPFCLKCRCPQRDPGGSGTRQAVGCCRMAAGDLRLLLLPYRGVGFRFLCVSVFLLTAFGGVMPHLRSACTVSWYAASSAQRLRQRRG